MKPPLVVVPDAHNEMRIRVAPDIRGFLASEGGQEFLTFYLGRIDHEKNVLLTCHPDMMVEVRGRIAGMRAFLFEVEKCLEAHRKYVEKKTGEPQEDQAKKDEEKIRKFLRENPERRPAGL